MGCEQAWDGGNGKEGVGEKQAGKVNVPVLHSLLQVGVLRGVDRRGMEASCGMGAEVWNGGGGVEGVGTKHALDVSTLYSQLLLHLPCGTRVCTRALQRT